MNYRSDFPIFTTNPDLVYLDSAATTQKPEVVIEAVSEHYRNNNANVHRGLYPLSQKATDLFENTRAQVAEFIGADSTQEIVFTRGATEAINLVAAGLSKNWSKEDEIILSQAEHHANLVPWQQTGATLRFVELEKTGEINLTHFESLLNEHTKLVTLTHCSNVLGRVNPLSQVSKILHKKGSGALFLVDAAQSVPHFPVSVQDLGADFLVFSGHKLYAPSGTGVLWGRAELLEKLPPYQTGGDMIKTVSLESSTWNDVPWKFEAGTPNIEGVIGLGVALSYLKKIDLDQVSILSTYARKKLQEIPGLTILGDPSPESGIISFVIEGIHPHDLADELGKQGVCIRAGHHCAAPLHATLNLSASCRISLGIYNNESDIDRFIEETNKILHFYKYV